jgi:hypothetical protein
MNVRTITFLGLSTLFLALLDAPLAAQTNPHAGCSLGLSRSTVSAGATVTVTENCGSGYTPGAPITLAFGSDPVILGTVTADEDGKFSKPVTIPSNARGGAHSVESSGSGANGSTLVLDASLRVTRTRGAGDAANRSQDSSDSAAFLWAALLALVVGAALVIGARWRATARSSDARSR